MRYLALILLFIVPQDDGFTVELLTPDEITALAKAEKDFAAAQQAHELAINRVKYAHGETPVGPWGDWHSCGEKVATVEIRGKYALIERHAFMGSCPVPASAAPVSISIP